MTERERLQQLGRQMQALSDSGWHTLRGTRQAMLDGGWVGPAGREFDHESADSDREIQRQLRRAVDLIAEKLARTPPG